MALTRVKSKNFAHPTGGAGEFLAPGSEDRRYHVVEDPLAHLPTNMEQKISQLAKITKERTGARVVIAKDGMFVTLERRPTVDRAWVVWASDGGPMIELVVVEKGEDREKVLADMVKKHGGSK